MRPLLSIVIANYNYGRFLEEAIRSVADQEMKDRVELIICDAASSDNSVEIIMKYASGLPPNTHYDEWRASHSSSAMPHPLITWWCSEKDGGQSAAFNKGFSHARGEWLTWLNADDVLLQGTIKAFEALVRDNRAAIWVTGNKLHFDSDTKRIISINWGPHSMPPLISGRHDFSAVYGPTTFFRKKLYEQMGPVDETLHYAMDSEYWARVTLAGIRQTRLHHICWGFRDHAESKTAGVQSEDVINRRVKETIYWHRKLNFDFPVSTINPWYVYWCLWRIIDGSWVKRCFLKRRYERKIFNKDREYK